MLAVDLVEQIMRAEEVWSGDEYEDATYDPLVICLGYLTFSSVTFQCLIVFATTTSHLLPAIRTLQLWHRNRARQSVLAQ